MFDKNKRKNFSEILLDKYWILPIFVSAITLINELFDHYHEGSLLQNKEFILEIIIFSISIPIAIFVLLVFLKKSTQERDYLQTEINRFQEYVRGLTKSENWDDLLENVSFYLQTFLPLERLFLSVVNPIDNTFQVASRWSQTGSIDASLIPDPYQNYQLGLLGSRLDADDSEILKKTKSPDNQDFRYYLPLVLNNIVFAVLHLDIRIGNELSFDQREFIFSLTPELNLAVAFISEKYFELDQKQSRLDERKCIGQMLHDTLAQDLSYLRLKLDHLQDQDNLIGLLEVQRDIERMQKVASSAYEQVRGTLVDLLPDASKNISKSLLILAHTICDPANIEIKFTILGQPQPLPPQTKKQLLDIAREVFANAVKHSNTSKIDLNIRWCRSQVTIEINDHGVGFSPEECVKEKHYGMIFMRERAEEVNADLKIISSKKNGTQIILSLPILETV